MSLSEFWLLQNHIAPDGLDGTKNIKPLVKSAETAMLITDLASAPLESARDKGLTDHLTSDDERQQGPSQVFRGLDPCRGRR